MLVQSGEGDALEPHHDDLHHSYEGVRVLLEHFLERSHRQAHHSRVLQRPCTHRPVRVRVTLHMAMDKYSKLTCFSSTKRATDCQTFSRTEQEEGKRKILKGVFEQSLSPRTFR